MRPALLLLLFCLKALPDAAQSRQISGVVLDGQTADVLQGVSVCRDTCSDETDTNGRFTVRAPSGEVSLDFKCAGYKTGHEALLPAQDFITVFLQPGHAAGKRAAAKDKAPDSAGGGLKGRVPVAVTALEAETYQRITENPFEEAAAFPFSSFTLSGDQVSYCNVRRFLNGDRLPPKEAVRVGEMINYLPAESPPDTAFSGSMGLQAKLITCPWNRSHWLLALKAETREMPGDTLPPSNLVLLIDISGSMSAPRKLALLKKAFDVLAEHLTASDRISVIVYSGNATLVLPATPGDRKAEIKSLINNLSAGGSTAGTAGIEMAFQVARRNFIPGGNNRVIMATDGEIGVC